MCKASGSWLTKKGKWKLKKVHEQHKVKGEKVDDDDDDDDEDEEEVPPTAKQQEAPAEQESQRDHSGEEAESDGEGESPPERQLQIVAARPSQVSSGLVSRKDFNNVVQQFNNVVQRLAGQFKQEIRRELDERDQQQSENATSYTNHHADHAIKDYEELRKEISKLKEENAKFREEVSTLKRELEKRIAESHEEHGKKLAELKDLLTRPQYEPEPTFGDMDQPRPERIPGTVSTLCSSYLTKK
jgi:hypothetical protein